MASTVCLILDSDLKFTIFPIVKKERQLNAFQYVCNALSPNYLGFCYGLPRKINALFFILQVFSHYFMSHSKSHDAKNP